MIRYSQIEYLVAPTKGRFSYSPVNCWRQRQRKNGKAEYTASPVNHPTKVSRSQHIRFTARDHVQSMPINKGYTMEIAFWLPEDLPRDRQAIMKISIGPSYSSLSVVRSSRSNKVSRSRVQVASLYVSDHLWIETLFSFMTFASFPHLLLVERMSLNPSLFGLLKSS